MAETPQGGGRDEARRARGQLADHHRSRALELSRATRDAKLAHLVELALAVDDTEAPLWIGGQLATPEQRNTSRADHWRRIFAHLAGEPDVLVMGTRAKGPADRVAWISGELRPDAEAALDFRVPDFTATFPELGSEKRRGAPIPRQRKAEFATRASRLAGGGRTRVSVGVLGHGTPTRTWESPLPGGKQAARRLVREHLAAAERAAREIAGSRRRVRLDDYMRHLVVYLLWQGHAELHGCGWRTTAQAFFDLEGPLDTRDDDEKWQRRMLRAVRDHYEASCRLIGREHVPGWPHIG
jgi:hypothetical protein